MSDQGWQPKESAPKDGSYFMAYDAVYGHLLTTLHWRGDEFITDADLWSGRFTHWMRLPLRPTEVRCNVD